MEPRKEIPLLGRIGPSIVGDGTDAFTVVPDVVVGVAALEEHPVRTAALRTLTSKARVAVRFTMIPLTVSWLADSVSRAKHVNDLNGTERSGRAGSLPAAFCSHCRGGGTMLRSGQSGSRPV